MEKTGPSEALMDLLVERGKLSEKDRVRLLGLKEKSTQSLVEIVSEQGIVDPHEMVHLLSETLELPVLHLNSYRVDRSTSPSIPQSIAERYGIVPVAKFGSIITLATSRPLDLITLDDLKELVGGEIRLVLTTPAEIHDALASAYLGAGALRQVLEAAGTNEIELIAPEEEELPAAKAVDEAPIVRMINRVIQEAVDQRASDIHFEPCPGHFRVRYRIDGVLKEAFRQSLDIYPALIARVKILSDLDITEKRVPQDGRFKMRLGEREIDFRVSVLPTFLGEKGVLRLLDKANVRSGLDELGFSEKPILLFKEAIRHPYGMILVTGPTGSGKSTTLYSVLNLLNTPERNLMTIEDPIEYQIEGITQTQVNPEIGLTFASGLRSLLRQSPDVVLVGEIRDTETADIAVKAALTGHLVLSTLHTNSASGAVTRLIDMGVEPFLIASSVILVAAQRLLRRICPRCKGPVAVPDEVLKRFGLASLSPKEKVFFKGKGCRACSQSGYLGRLGAIEVLPVDSEIRNAILGRASSETIEKIARKKGMETLFANAFNLLREGKTTLEEVLRVTAVEEREDA